MAEYDWVYSLILTVFPFAALCAALQHGRSVRRALTTKDGRSLAQVVDELLREIRRANDLRAAEAQTTTSPRPAP